MAEKKLTVEMDFEDKYTDEVRDAADETDKLDRSLQSTEKSSMEANIAFLATVDALDKFGSGVSKIKGGLEDLNVVNEEQAEQLQKVVGAVDIFVGSAEIAVIGMAAWTRATEAQKTAMIGLGLASASAGLAIAAVNAQTKEGKAILSAMTGVTTGLAIAQFTLALATASQRVAAAGPAAPVVAGLIGGGLVAVGTYWAAIKSQAGAQTAPGEERVFEADTGGVIEIHGGETARITREGRTSPALRQREGVPAIGTFNLTLVSAIDPFNPAGQRAIAERTADYMDRVLGSLK